MLEVAKMEELLILETMYTLELMLPLTHVTLKVLPMLVWVHPLVKDLLLRALQ